MRHYFVSKVGYEDSTFFISLAEWSDNDIVTVVDTLDLTKEEVKVKDLNDFVFESDNAFKFINGIYNVFSEECDNDFVFKDGSVNLSDGVLTIDYRNYTYKLFEFLDSTGLWVLVKRDKVTDRCYSQVIEAVDQMYNYDKLVVRNVDLEDDFLSFCFCDLVVVISSGGRLSFSNYRRVGLLKSLLETDMYMYTNRPTRLMPQVVSSLRKIATYCKVSGGTGEEWFEYCFENLVIEQPAIFQDSSVNRKTMFNSLPAPVREDLVWLAKKWGSRERQAQLAREMFLGKE